MAAEQEPESPLADYSALERKIRRARLRKDRMKRWAKWAGVIGALGFLLFIVGLLLFAPRFPKGNSQPGDDASTWIAMLFAFAPFAALAAGAVGAAAAAIVDLLRPIWLALTDTTRFEQEYGSPLPPHS